MGVTTTYAADVHVHSPFPTTNLPLSDRLRWPFHVTSCSCGLGSPYWGNFSIVYHSESIRDGHCIWCSIEDIHIAVDILFLPLHISQLRNSARPISDPSHVLSPNYSKIILYDLITLQYEPLPKNVVQVPGCMTTYLLLCTRRPATFHQLPSHELPTRLAWQAWEVSTVWGLNPILLYSLQKPCLISTCWYTSV